MAKSKNVKASELPLTKKSGGPKASGAGKKGNDAGLQGNASNVPAASAAVVTQQEAAKTANKKAGVAPFGAPAEVGDLKDAPKQDRDLARIHNPEVDETSTSKRKR